ncbi:hypothetical protein SIN8267_02841 [Sinobacterium norvegicum]|uniref:Uncharacterized protein n=1 Tax=Sinobacterium norvegicum TaxID=1641715 RepID=A0ABM9AHK5_9GAMM|nr:hypothetical protein [Sinobacterium norvegicum]CAH0992708.1 hypothetical protein SIN8267_02841 [Sinobacterium norvegicum]
MHTVKGSDNKANVVNIFSGRPVCKENDSRIVRLSPECDGISMLYTNNTNNAKLYRMSILCWALRENGQVDALVPWLDNIYPCSELNSPVDGQWEGYYETCSETVFDEPPEHKISSLIHSAEYFGTESAEPDDVLQQFADTIGTHALLCERKTNSITLTEVLSWRLLANGSVQAMLIDENKITDTPVLPGDPALYPAGDNPAFKYFFQHHIANQIKSQDPDTLSAISVLLNGKKH